MRKFSWFGLVFLALALAGFGLVADAQAETYVSPEKIDLIKTHCTENQATLNTLHQNDTFLRTNRGDVYRTVNDKLMLPFNQRLAANQLDGGQLITTAATFKAAYARFFDSYISYDNALVEVLKIDCKEKPEKFYTALTNAREKRAELSEANQAIVRIINDYYKAFKDFKTNFSEQETN